MPEFKTKRRVRHAAAEMFALVADVEHYPEFVPFCRSLRVRKRSQDAQGRETFVCEMTISYKLILEYLSGPFHRLENRWSFRPAGEQACDVEFFLSYEFQSRALALVMGAMFEAVFRRFADAFERRADQIYAQPRTTT